MALTTAPHGPYGGGRIATENERCRSTKDRCACSARQGCRARRHAAAEDRHAVRHRRERRQGVLLDHRRCRAWCKAWEPVRKRAEEAVRGDARRAVGDGRADRRAQGAAPPRRRPRRPRRRRARRRARRAARRSGRPGVPGVERDHRGRLRQGRRRQVHHRGQSRARPARSRPEGRHARRRHLRPVAAEAARDPASSRRPSAARGSSRSRATASP